MCVCVCVCDTLLILFIHLITIHWFNIRSLVLPLWFDRLHKMFITRTLVFFLWPPKPIVVSQNRIIKTRSSLVSQRRHFLPLFNVKFDSKHQLCFDVWHVMTYLNQQRFTSNIIHNIWECFKIFHVYAFNFSTSDSQYWPKHLILWIHRLDSRCDMMIC